MYEKKLAAVKAECDALRVEKVKPFEPALILPLNIGHEEIEEIDNTGFSKKFVKIARQAVLVALRKENSLD